MSLGSNQVQYSLLYRAPETNGVADAVRDAGATLIAYSPLCQGLLTGAVLSPSLPPPSPPPPSPGVCMQAQGVILGLHVTPTCITR